MITPRYTQAERFAKMTRIQDATIREQIAKYEGGIRYFPLSSPPRTGKTRTAILWAKEVARRLRARGKRGLILMITVATVKGNIAKQFVEWGDYAEPEVLVVIGDAQLKMGQILMVKTDPSIKVVVTNYDNISDNQPLWQMLMDDPSDNIILLDEADAIQNVESGYSTSVRSLEKHAAAILTATTFSNRADSGYALLTFLDDGPSYERTEEFKFFGKTKARHHHPGKFWGSKQEFENTFCTFSSYGKPNGCKNIPLLHRKLEQFGMVLWDKQDMLSIGKAHSKIVVLRRKDISPDWNEYYDHVIVPGAVAALEEQGQELVYKAGDDGMKLAQASVFILAIRMRVRRGCLMSPRDDAFYYHKSRSIDYKINVKSLEGLSNENPKARWLAQYAAERWQDGLFVYSPWTGPFDDLQRGLGDIWTKAGGMILDSSVPEQKRTGDADSIEEKVRRGECKVVLSSPAGGAGIDLQNCHYSVCLGLPDRARDVLQPMGRGEGASMSDKFLDDDGLPYAEKVFPVIENCVEDKTMIPLIQGKQDDIDQITTGKRGGKHATLSLTELINDVIAGF